MLSFLLELLDAVTNENLTETRRLLSIDHADVNLKTFGGQTALMMASSFGSHKIVKELLNHHADVNVKNYFGRTALMEASSSGHHKIVKELLNHHADINVQNHRGETALTLASKKKHTQIVTELIDHNADVNFKIGLVTRHCTQYSWKNSLMLQLIL